MTDEEYINSKKDRPFMFFGREFSKAQIEAMDFQEVEDWISQAKQVVSENHQYAMYQESKGIVMAEEEVARRIGFTHAITKFTFLLEDRKKKLGDNRYKVFFEHCERELDEGLFTDLCKEVDDIIAGIPYEAPEQMRLV